VLKGRSSDPGATKDIQEFLLIKHLNLTPAGLKRLPHADKVKYSILINEMMGTAPALLGINKIG